MEGARVKPVLRNGGLVVELERDYRCISSAVLGGGLGSIRTWLNLQVASGYDCADPEADLRAAARGLRGPVVGMLTAAPVARFVAADRGSVWAIATVGLQHPIAAAASDVAESSAAGTINLLVILETPLSDAGLVNAVQTAVEAKAQALASARVVALNADGFATGTATDSVCVACPPGGESSYAGPATRHGRDLARAVHSAVLSGAKSGTAEALAESE